MAPFGLREYFILHFSFCYTHNKSKSQFMFAVSVCLCVGGWMGANTAQHTMHSASHWIAYRSFVVWFTENYYGKLSELCSMLVRSHPKLLYHVKYIRAMPVCIIFPIKEEEKEERKNCIK